MRRVKTFTTLAAAATKRGLKVFFALFRLKRFDFIVEVVCVWVLQNRVDAYTRSKTVYTNHRFNSGTAEKFDKWQFEIYTAIFLLHCVFYFCIN